MFYDGMPFQSSFNFFTVNFTKISLPSSPICIMVCSSSFASNFTIIGKARIIAVMELAIAVVIVVGPPFPTGGQVICKSESLTGAGLNITSIHAFP